MANEEQVALLKQGSKVWNQWREENPDISIRLSYADLSDANLSEVSLHNADLRNAYLDKANFHSANLYGAVLCDSYLTNANLIRANLCSANLCNAKLAGANLTEINLCKAELISADLSKTKISSGELNGANLRFAKLCSAVLCDASLTNADLYEADLTDADLSDANLSNTEMIWVDLSNARLIHTKLCNTDLNFAILSNADLIYANLRKADLSYTSLLEADLGEADFSYTTLTSANLSRATLINTNFKEANLDKAILISTDLSRADFHNANLHDADLRRSRVLSTDFTGATLTGTCIADWQISSSTILDGVKCDYIFRTYDAEKREFSGRLPVDSASTFAPREFIQRFQIIASALETIDITFTEGIDWQAFFQSFQELRDGHPDEDISIQGMERKGDAFVVRLEVAAEADKGAIETEVKQLYAHQLAALEAQYEQRLQLQGARLEDAQRTIEIERQRNTELIGVIGIVAQNQGSKYDMRGAQFAGGFAENVQGDQYGGVINNYGQDADDIVQLLKALRTWSQALPEAQKDDVIMELDALEADLNKPEKPETKRLGKRLQRLLAAGTAAATIANGAVTFSGNVNEFTDDVLELGEKIGLTREDIQAQP